LGDASKSGVYRASRTDEILDATRGSTLRVSRIDLSGGPGKEALMERIARALDFPRWFGGNWDALEDCLTDLSWSKADGHVLLLEGVAELPADDRGMLVDVLAAAAAWWLDRKRPFFAVFLGSSLPLPELYNSRR
jgi:hypothetical protein